MRSGSSQVMKTSLASFAEGISKLGLTEVGYAVALIGDLLRFLQTGNVRNYALMFFLGVIVFIWVFA